MRALAVVMGLAVVLSEAVAGEPVCSGPDSWPAAMAYASLKNEKLISTGDVDTAKTKSVNLASEKKDGGLYHQIHLITFTLKSGGNLSVITSNDASEEECSMSRVDVFVISKRLGGDSVPSELVTAPREIVP